MESVTLTPSTSLTERSKWNDCRAFKPERIMSPFTETSLPARTAVAGLVSAPSRATPRSTLSFATRYGGMDTRFRLDGKWLDTRGYACSSRA